MTATHQNPKTWTYETERVLLVPVGPLTTEDSILGPDILVRLWAMLERDRLIDVVFYGMGKITLTRLVSMLSNSAILIGLAKPADGSTDTKRCEIIGFGFLFGVEGEGEFRKSQVAMVGFRPFWRTPEIRQLARLALRWWFEELKIGVLFGTVLASNAVVVNFARKLGFTKVALLPKFYCRPGGFDDAFMVTLTRDQYYVKLGAREGGNGPE
jgi:hypothetical protein